MVGYTKAPSSGRLKECISFYNDDDLDAREIPVELVKQQWQYYEHQARKLCLWQQSPRIQLYGIRQLYDLDRLKC